MSELIAVTGATGFIGGAICRVLHAAGYRVRVLARSPQRLQSVSPFVDEVIQGDLHTSVALSQLVDGAAAVVHCAGVVRGASQVEFDRVNVDGLVNLLTALDGATVATRLFYLSSLAAREPSLSFYARSKARSESLLRERAGERNWLALRPPAVYGPGDRELLPLFRLMSRGIAPLPGSPDARFSMVYVDDIARLVLAWLQQEVSASNVYSVDDGRDGGYSWQDVAATVAGLCQRPVRPIRVPEIVMDVPAWINRWLARWLGYAPMLTPEKLCELRHPDWVCHNTDLQAVVAWQPAYQLSEGLRHTPGWCSRLQ